jgi:phospho-N-acetylmuramoyl-pentapeptide-transferase
VLFVVWVILMVTGTSNGVNLTDGLDGLATGAAILVLAAYMIIGIWQLRNDCTVASPRLLRRPRPAGPGRWSPPR